MIKEQVKEQVAHNYQLATMVAQFVNMSMGGKNIPSLTEYAPYLFTTNKQEKFKEDHNGLTEAEYNKALLARDQFIMLAKQKKANKEGKTDVN